MAYDELIRRVADKYGVDPSLLWGVVKTESNFNPKATSKVGAVGLAQLMPATAAQYGVDPRDPEQNLDGAAQHLAYLTKRYKGDTKKALAAYNAGEGRIDRGGTLPSETQAYVPKVLTNAKGYRSAPENMTEQQRAAYERDKAEFEAYQKDRADYQAYLSEKHGGGVIKEGSARRTVSPGAMIGGTIGAVAGGMATAPSGGLGAIPGAVAGAAIGELGQQAYDTMTNSAYAPHSTEESLKRVGMEAGFAAAGELTAGGITLLRPVRYAQPRVLTQEQQQTKAVLDQHRIPYTPDQITGSPFHTFARSVADSGLLSEATMQEFVKDQSAAIRGAVKGVANTMGQHVPPDELGQQVIRHIRGENKTLTDTVIQPLYNKIDKDLQYQALPGGRVQGGLLVDQTPVKQQFQNEVLNLERTARQQNQPDLLKSASYQSMKRFLALPDNGQWVDAHTVLKEIRRDLRELDNPTNVATEVLKDKSVLTRAEKVLEQQLETALKNSSNPAHQADLALWQQAQKEVKGRSERLRNEVVLKFTKAIEEHGGEKGLTQFVNNMTPEDMSKVMNATKSDPALQGSLRRSFLEDKIIKAGGMEDAEAPFNAEKFRKVLFGKDENAARKAEVLLDPQQRQKLKEFTNAVSDIQNGPESKFGIFLKLQSAKALMTLSAGSLATLGLISGRQGDTEGATAGFGGAATILLGPKVLASLMTNPRAVEYMIQGLRYTATDKSNIVRVTRELMRIDQNFARAVQLGASAYSAEQTSGPLHRTAESVSKTIQSTLPEFGLGNFQQ